MSEYKASCSLGGCLTVIVVCIALWALVFGVTVDGKHHGLSCSSEDGVKVE